MRNKCAEEIDRLIISGELIAAKSRFFAAEKRGEFSKARYDFAWIARRLNFPMIALRILHPRITLGLQTKDLPPLETSEYAASLTYVGVYQEANSLLKQVSKADAPESLLFLAFNFIAQWNYRDAIPCIEEYLALSSLSKYQRMVAEVNLLTALIYEKNPLGRPLVETVLQRAKESGYKRLMAIVLLQKGEMEVWDHRWTAAFSALTDALNLISDHNSNERLLVEKWIAIATLYAYPERSRVTSMELTRIKKRAKELEDWETIRSCDFHTAIADHNEELATRVIFGTPHASLKERLVSEFKTQIHLPDSYILETSGSPSETISLLENGLKRWPLKCGQLGHRFLLCLSQDFYRTTKVSEVYAKLFGKEHFDPISSPARIRKLVERVRTALLEENMPLAISVRHRAISLNVSPGFALRVPASREVSSPIETLEVLMGNKESLSIREISRRLDFSYSKTARLVYSAYRQKQIARDGRGKNAKYRFAA